MQKQDEHIAHLESEILIRDMQISGQKYLLGELRDVMDEFIKGIPQGAVERNDKSGRLSTAQLLISRDRLFRKLASVSVEINEHVQKNQINANTTESAPGSTENRLMKDQLSRVEPLLKDSSYRLNQLRGVIQGLGLEASDSLCCGFIKCRLLRNIQATAFERKFVCLGPRFVKILHPEEYTIERTLSIAEEPIFKRFTSNEVSYHLKSIADDTSLELKLTGGIQLGKWEWALSQISQVVAADS